MVLRILYMVCLLLCVSHVSPARVNAQGSATFSPTATVWPSCKALKDISSQQLGEYCLNDESTKSCYCKQYKKTLRKEIKHKRYKLVHGLYMFE